MLKFERRVGASKILELCDVYRTSTRKVTLKDIGKLGGMKPQCIKWIWSHLKKIYFYIPVLWCLRQNQCFFNSTVITTNSSTTNDDEVDIITALLVSELVIHISGPSYYHTITSQSFGISSYWNASCRILDFTSIESRCCAKLKIWNTDISITATLNQIWTRGGMNKMADTMHTAYFNRFSLKKICVLWFKFHRCLFLKVKQIKKIRTSN